MQIIQIVVGLALLVFGRKGLGVFLGAIGFIAGMGLASTLFEGSSTGVAIAIGALGGVVGVFLAFFVQKVAIVAAGVLGGGAIGFHLAHDLGMRGEGFPWIPVIVCAVQGVLLAYFLVKWALILLSSVLGAYLVVGGLDVQGVPGMALFAALAVAGIVFQARSGKVSRKASPT